MIKIWQFYCEKFLFFSAVSHMQDKLIKSYFDQHHLVLILKYKEMPYFWGDFPLDSNIFLILSVSNIASILSTSLS